MQLYDYGLSTLEQYGLSADSSCRTRGGLLCRTSSGLLILREFHGSEKKLGKQQELLRKLQENGRLVDVFLENMQGSLVSRDKDEIPYTLQYWYEGRECDTKSREDILKSVYSLAELHCVMKIPCLGEYQERSLEEEYLRHNQELKKIRKFVRKKGASCNFEKLFLSSVQWFLDKGEKALELLAATGYQELRRQALEQGCICHGEYNQHNVLMLKNGLAVTNFGQWSCDIQISDLYRFMRKILEKYQWDVGLGEKMLETYHKRKPISFEEWENLKIRFSYPEKYWKLANHYYTHNKVFISEKNLEKLQTLISQKENWEKFLEKCFEKYPF